MRTSSCIAALIVLLAPLFLLSPLCAAEPTTEPASVETGDMRAAELRLLRAQVKQLQTELAASKAEIAQLKAKLVSVGIAPEDTKDTAATADAKPKRVVFVIESIDYAGGETAAREEVRRAISELQPDQWFNVIVTTQAGPRPFSSTMLSATPANREKATAFIASQGLRSKSADALAAALQFHPQVVYFIGIWVDDATRAEVKKRNAGVNAAINTTTAFGIISLDRQRVLWQLAHDTGGVCVDSKGNTVDEPVLPVKIERPQPQPATKPSIFNRNP